MKPLSDLLDRPINDVLCVRSWLSDLLTAQHRTGHLLGECQADERAAEPDHQGPDQELLIEHSSHIDSECRQDDVDQQIGRERERDIDQEVCNQE